MTSRGGRHGDFSTHMTGGGDGAAKSERKVQWGGLSEEELVERQSEAERAADRCGDDDQRLLRRQCNNAEHERAPCAATKAYGT